MIDVIVAAGIASTLLACRQPRADSTGLVPTLRTDSAEYGVEVEVTADVSNLASQRVIVTNGGRLVEQVRKPLAYGGGTSLRFRISLAASAQTDER